MAAWVTAALLFSAVQLLPSAPQPLPPPGNRIVAQDGDTVVVDHHARVRIVRSTQANVRTVFNAAERWVMVLADFAEDGGPDGRVDSTRSYYGVNGDWPLEPRWEGTATLEEYVGIGPGTGAPGFGLRTPDGLVQFLSPAPQPNIFRDPDALAVIFARGSSGDLARDAPAVAPADAQRAGIRGVVIIEVAIDVDGRVPCRSRMPLPA